MKLTRQQTPTGPRWAADSLWLAETFDLPALLELPRTEMATFIESQRTIEPAEGELLAPIESNQEVWASGVTYMRSREARRAESDMGDVYDRVYVAERPELFFKANGWRVRGFRQNLRIRADSDWNVPEPELTMVINRHGEIIGYTAGNDMSSRSIEGENPLYLPQAKIYDASCALGPAIRLLNGEDLHNIFVAIVIQRASEVVFQGHTSTANMNRKMDDLVEYLCRELNFPHGVFLMTGTGIVPPDEFTLANGDMVTITVGDLTLINEVGL